jgi:long-subunit acyl-CoA synthetase (AMP-forming)
VIAAGATLVPLDPALSDAAVHRALESTEAVQAIASDERQLARILALRPELSELELVLLMTAPPSERRPAALLAKAAMNVGAASLATDPSLLRRAFAESEGGTACLLVDPTGGTRPVGRAALFALADAVARALGLAAERSLLSALPVGGVERLGTALAAWGNDVTLLLADPGERPDAGLDQRPADSVILDVAGLERLYRAWNDDIGAKSWLGRGATRWALRQGRVPERHPWRHRIAEIVLLRRMRERLGGRAVALDVIAPAAGRAPSHIDLFFAAIGLPVRYLPSDAVAVLAR